jgi:hypothetical protein
MQNAAETFWVTKTSLALAITNAKQIFSLNADAQ